MSDCLNNWLTDSLTVLIENSVAGNFYDLT